METSPLLAQAWAGAASASSLEGVTCRSEAGREVGVKFTGSTRERKGALVGEMEETLCFWEVLLGSLLGL